ncbi:MAG: hypothetical protein LBN10_00310 [Propionibacteriaceae bacterium]|nr:hypothetical protein [Propionibacteriaceae bacterium]
MGFRPGERREDSKGNRSEARLAWFVREAWPSPATGVELTEGIINRDEELVITVRSDHLVVFGDGIEDDRLEATWGQDIRLRVAAQRLRLAM